MSHSRKLLHQPGVGPVNRRRGGTVGNPENVALVLQFIEACVRADPEEFGQYFTEDAV
jgi:hypothetical protein